MNRLDEVADLRDDVDRAAQRFERAAASAIGPFIGKDGSGRVAVTADDAGRMTGVRVAPDWRSELEPVDLAAAVLEAYTSAGMTRAKAWGESLAAEAGATTPAVRPLPPFRDSISGQVEEILRARGGMDAEEGRVAMQGIANFLRDVTASIDEASAEVARVQQERVRGASSGGHVHVTIGGTGDVAEIHYDEAWLARAHPANIGRETEQAYLAALRLAGGKGVAEVVAATRLGRLQALASDPEALARYLRTAR